MFEFFAIAAGYILGSIPAAYLIAKLRKGIDIREVGVRNMGAGAVFREVGIPEGILCTLIDIGKGTAAVYVAQVMGLAEYWIWAAGFAAILGHSFPVFIGFRGGKSVATLIGVMLPISPLTMCVVLVLIAIVWLIVRHLFTTMAIVAPFLLLTTWLVERSPQLMVYVVIVVLFIVLRAWYRLGEVKTALSTVGKRRSQSG